jgi:hypothetical protein
MPANRDNHASKYVRSVNVYRPGHFRRRLMQVFTYICYDSKSLSLVNPTHFFAVIEMTLTKREGEEKRGGRVIPWILSPGYICPFAMLYKVQTYLFFLWSDPYAAWPHHIHYLDNECSDAHRPGKCSKCAYRIFI